MTSPWRPPSPTHHLAPSLQSQFWALWPSPFPKQETPITKDIPTTDLSYNENDIPKENAMNLHDQASFGAWWPSLQPKYPITKDIPPMPHQGMNTMTFKEPLPCACKTLKGRLWLEDLLNVHGKGKCQNVRCLCYHKTNKKKRLQTYTNRERKTKRGRGKWFK